MKTKIINYLKGGIGNQLFQYAFAKSLASKFDCELFHDVSYYSFDPYGNKSIISELDPSSNYINISQINNSRIFKLNDELIRSIDQINNIPEDVDFLLLDGYWQSEDYHDELIVLFINKLLKEKYKFDEIIRHEGRKDIAVHIRRRDYEHMGLCKIEYYTGLMNYILDNYSDVAFQIYTDTPNFSKQFLSFRSYNLKYINTGSDLKDLYLMSQCSDFIISNSTYSWWAAYLGENYKTKVFAPKEWVTLPNVKSPCPNRWKLIENAIVPFGYNFEQNKYFYCQAN